MSISFHLKLYNIINVEGYHHTCWLSNLITQQARYNGATSFRLSFGTGGGEGCMRDVMEHWNEGEKHDRIGGTYSDGAEE